MHQDNEPNRRSVFLGAVRLIGGFSVLELLHGCGGSGSGSPSDPNVPLIARGQYGAIQFTLTTTKSVFARGEEIPFVFAISNTGTEPFVYGTGSPRYGTLIFQGNTPIWDSHFGLGLIADSIVTLAPEETKRYEFTWSQKNSKFTDAPEAQVSPGVYQVTTLANMIPGGSGVDPETSSQLSAGPLSITIR